jgi:hypothetical protein
MNDKQSQLQTFSPEPILSERDYRMRGALTELTLRNENRIYARTAGVSQRNRAADWHPGYLNRRTGETARSRYADGRPAPVHVLDGLPEAWVRERDAMGRVIAAHAEIVSGFIRNGQFYTREQAARATAH